LLPTESIGDESFVRAWGNLSDEPLTLCGTGRFVGVCAATLRTGPTASRAQVKPTVSLNIESGRVAMTVEAEIAELGIGRKFQKPTVFQNQTVADNLELALKSDRHVRATLWWQEGPSERRRIDELLATIRLTAVRDRLAGSLSHGQRQWLEIGMLLAQDPKLLLVDEPVAGMTDVETQQTAELLKEINRDRTVVVVEHDMAFVRELGVKVTCLHEGSVLAEGSIDQVSTNERVVEVYLGR